MKKFARKTLITLILSAALCFAGCSGCAFIDNFVRGTLARDFAKYGLDKLMLKDSSCSTEIDGNTLKVSCSQLWATDVGDGFRLKVVYSVLSSGAVLNLRLSDTISTVFFNFTGEWYLNSTGWWTALVLFIFMAAAQIVSMLLPQWINKKRLRKVARLTKNPAQDKNTKTMKWVMYGMMVFTIIMGFFLPSAMAVYWFIGALISMVQTAITQAVIAKQDKKKKERRYR